MATLAEIRALTAKHTREPDITTYVKWVNAIIEQTAKRGRSSVTNIFADMKKVEPPTEAHLQLIERHFKNEGYNVELGNGPESLKIDWA